MQLKNIVLSSTSHIVKDDFLDYVAYYRINDAFKPAKSHSEAELLSTYAPYEEYGKEGSVPYIAVQEDDAVFCAIDEFKENRTFEGAIEIVPLSEKYLFKAKREYFGDIMYFYAFICEKGFWEQAALCLIYQKEYVGTDDEKKLISVLDEAAETFEQKLII